MLSFAKARREGGGEESGGLATSLDYFCMYICLAVVDAQKVAWDGYEPMSAEKLQRKHIGKQRVHTHACTHHSQRPSLRRLDRGFGQLQGFI